MWLTRVSVNHPVFATMMMLAFVVLGLFSYKRLSVDQFPDIQLPVVVVGGGVIGVTGTSSPRRRTRRAARPA